MFITKPLFHLNDKEDLEVFQKKTEQALDLRRLTRQHSALTDSYVEIKLQFQAALDQIFPAYHHAFSDLYGSLSLNTLWHYPTAFDIHNTHQELAVKMRECGARRSHTWFLNKAQQLKEAAERNPFQHPVHRSHLISLRMYIQMLFQWPL